MPPCRQSQDYRSISHPQRPLRTPLTAWTRSIAPLKRLALFGFALGFALLSCGRDLTSPGARDRFARGIAWRTQFPAAYQQAGAAAAGIVAFTKVRVLLHHADGTVAIDTTVDFGANTDSLPLTLDVKLLPSAPATGEPLSLDLAYINAAGDTVFKGGPVSVLAVPTAAVATTPTTPVTIPVAYTGPGATAVGVQVSPRTGSASSGNTYTYNAVAVDGSGNPVAGTPIFWSSRDTTAATLPNAAVGTVLATGKARTTAWIVAQLLTGQSDSVVMNVQPPATTVAIQSGTGQTGTVGTALANPLVVYATAADGGPVGGVNVTFAVTGGGGSVAATTVTTNASGLAQTTWTLGGTPGAQTVTATAGTLSGSPLTFTATATAPAHLQVTTSPAAAQVAGTTVTPGFVVSAYDANNNQDPTFTGTVTLAIGTNPGGATLSGTTSVSAVAGVATFNAFSLNKAGTGYTVVASAAGYVSGTSTAFNVAAGAATTIAINGGNNQTGPANSQLAQPLSVLVTDAGGNPVSGVTVQFHVASGGGSVGTAAPVTNASGIATTTWTVGASGSQSVGAAALNALGQPLTGSPLVFTANGTGAVASTTVAPHLDTLTAIGATFTAAAVAKDAAGNIVTGTFAWTSRTPAVATVATGGLITAVTNGSAWVVATETGGTKDSVLIVVQQRLATINVSPGTSSIYLGNSSPAFTATAVDGLGVALSAQPSITWSTTSSAIASITSGGVATGVGLGSTLVQATAGAVTGVATLNVVTRIKFIFVARDSVGFSQTKSDTFTVAALGNSRSYKAFAYDSTLTALPGITFTFLSSNGSVAAIDSTGTVTVRATAAANGTTAISASAQGVSGAAVMNVQQVLTSITLSPATAAIAASGSTPLTARGLDANGRFINSVIAFTYVSSAPTIATVSASGVVTGVAPGSTNITASNGSIVSNIAVVTVQSVGVTPVISFGRDTVTVGRSSSASIPIYLSKPAASPLTIKFAVKDTFAFFNPTTIVIPAGSTTGNATLNGHNAGTTLVTATDSSGLGYVPDTSVLAVQATVHLTTTTYNLVVTDQISTQVLLSDPSPAGGTYVTFGYGTPGRALVSPDPAFIPAGQLAANVVILATGAGGTTITPAATGVNGTNSTVNTSAANLSISPTALRIGAGQYDLNDNVQSPQYLNSPVSVTLTSADTNTVSVPSPIVMPSGLYYQYFNTTAKIPGLVNVTASAPGWVDATMSVRVTTPKLGLSGGTTLNTTSPASSFVVYAEDSTFGTHYRTNALNLTVSSSDPTVLTVSSPTLTIPAGSYYVSSGTVTPVGGGSAWLKVTASGHIADSTLYTVVGPKLRFGWTSNIIGVGQIDHNENVQGPNYVTSPLTVTIANPDSTIVGMPPTVVIPTSSYYVYFDVRGKALGSESFIASAPGYQPDTATYTVTTPRLVLSGGGTLQNFGPAQTFTVYPADSTRTNHYTINPIIVSYASTDPTVFTVNSTDTIQAGASYTQHGAVVPVGAGTAKLIASAPGYLPDTVTYVVQTPKIAFSFSHNVIGKRQYDVNPADIQTPNYLTAPLTATITQLHPTVDSLSATTIVIPSGIYYSYFNYAGLNTGTDTLIVSAPGYLPDTAVLTVSSQRLYTSGGGLPGTALTTTAPATVTVYAADTVNNIHYSLDTVAINAVSSNTAVIQPTAPLIHLLKGAQYVQPLVAYTGPGSASVTYSDSAGVYLPVTTNTVAVTGPSLFISNGTTILGKRQNGGGSSANVQVQNNVTSTPLVITLTSSDTLVATVPATVTIPVGTYYVYFPITAHDSTGAIRITATAAGYGSGTSDVQVEQPKFLISTSTSVNTTSPRQSVNVYAEDSHGNVHFTNEDVAVTLASSNAFAGTIDSSVVVIAAGTQINNHAQFIPGQAGTTTLSAHDARSAPYRYTPDATQDVAVNTPTLSLWGSSVTLGVGQYVDQNVLAADYQSSPLTVSLTHFNGASSTPSSVTIPTSSYYTAVRVTGATAGTDTVTASATGENSVKSAVIVDLGRVDQNSNWPSTLSLAGTDSVLVTIYTRDQASNVRFVSAATTFTLTGSANVSFVSGGATISSVTVAAGAQSAQFYVKGTSQGTSSVSISNANYTTYAPTIVVTP